MASDIATDQGCNSAGDIPKDYVETFIVTTPVKVRFHKQDCRITYMETRSPLTGKAWVGDVIVGVDGKVPKSGEDIKKFILDTNSPRVALRIQHSNWSWSHLRLTTVEHFVMDKDTERYTGRAIELHEVFMKINVTPEIMKPAINFQVRYDARERLVISEVDKSSVSSAHLKVGDIIREVNGKPTASKTMLRHRIIQSLQKTGTVHLLVESLVGGNDFVPDSMEMSPDVIKIAKEQKERLRMAPKTAVSQGSTPTKTPSKTPAKSPVGKKRAVTFSALERQEIRIASDCDTGKLRAVKNSNI